MSDSVCDSSAFLAVLLGEPFDPALVHVLDQSNLSAVNFSEILTRLKHLNVPLYGMHNLLRDVKIHPFTAAQAHIASDLRNVTARFGLSFGDRACLALAMERGAEVYTADRAWAKAALPCKVHLIR